MKKSLTATFFLITIFFGSALFALAQTNPVLTVNIPFAFHAGSQVLPAGEYTIRMLTLGHSATGSIVAIQTKDGSVHLYLNANPGDARSAAPAYTATFKKYSGRYFLSEVQNGWLASSLVKTRAERELAIADAGKSDVKNSDGVVLTSSTPQ